MPQSAKDDAIGDITTTIQAGILHFQIAKTFSLQQVADAHEAQDSEQTIGKIIIEMARISAANLVQPHLEHCLASTPQRVLSNINERGYLR